MACSAAILGEEQFLNVTSVADLRWLRQMTDPRSARVHGEGSRCCWLLIHFDQKISKQTARNRLNSYDRQIIVADGPTTDRTAIPRASSRSRLPELQLSAPDRDAAHGDRHLLPLRQVRRDLDAWETWDLERSTLRICLSSREGAPHQATIPPSCPPRHFRAPCGTAIWSRASTS